MNPEALKSAYCTDCPAYYLHTSHTPEDRNGITVRYGDRICYGGKQPFIFTAWDPKKLIPCWCPRLKSPPILRVHEFISESDRMAQMAAINNISAHHYRLKAEVEALFSVKEFWARRNVPLNTEILPMPVDLGWIVEFDNGVRPLCFIRKVLGFRFVNGFKPELARAAQLEQPPA